MGLDICLYRIRKYDISDDSNRIELLNYQTGEPDRNGFPDWTKKFETEITDTFYDFKKFAKIHGFDFNKMNFILGDTCKFFDDETKKEIEVGWDDIPSNDIVFNVLGYDEIGYQRKGVIDKFYDDYENQDSIVYIWTLEEAYKIKEYITDNMKEYFQKNILDNFVEGETVIYISW